MPSSSTQPTFHTLYTHLLTHPAPLLPPGKSLLPHLTAQISALSLHPTLEAALHILNHDLPSAHFLVRHMQAAPAFEGMFLHGILHRVEGDYDNARAWYADVSTSRVYQHVWGHGGKMEGEEDGKEGEGQEEGKEGEGDEDGKDGGDSVDKGRRFIDRVEVLKKEGKGDREVLENESLREIKAVVEWCVDRFGTGVVVDATSAPGAWVRPSEKIQKMGEDQVSGEGGARNF